MAHQFKKLRYQTVFRTKNNLRYTLHNKPNKTTDTYDKPGV